MSRSCKLPIFKDKGLKDLYHRIVKRRTRTYLRSNLYKLLNEDFDVNIPNPKTILSDYDYSDYRFDLCYNKENKLKSKWSRK